MTGTHAPGDSTADAPAVFAHRGFAGRYPENTLLAVRRCAADADRVELDVVPTADGDPVVFHDLALDDLTDRDGVVFETPTSEVTSAEVLDSGETVPTLDASLAACERAGVDPNLELKNPGSFAVRPDERLAGDDLAAARERWASFVDTVLDALDGFGDGVLVSSFCAAPLALVAERSDHDAAAITSDPATGLAVARDHGCVAVHPHLGSVLETPPAGRDGDDGAGDAASNPVPEPDSGVLAAAHEAGLAVNAWTVRTWHEAHRLRTAGVDGIIADYPGLGSPPDR